MTRRRYTDQEKSDALAALAANGGNVQQTANQLNIPYSTLEHWANGERIHPAVVQMGEEKKLPLADRLHDLAHTVTDKLPAKIGKASFQQACVGLGIIIDKMHRLRGEPTDLAKELTPDEFVKRMREILGAAGETAAGPAAGSPADGEASQVPRVDPVSEHPPANGL